MQNDYNNDFAIKKVDRLGRIVIPIELRRKYNLNEGASVSFKEENGEIHIAPLNSVCKICGKALISQKNIPLYGQCVLRVRSGV